MDTSELEAGYKALTEIGITGRPLYVIKEGEVVGIACTIDTRGLRTQSCADAMTRKAKKAMEAVCNLPVTVQATGHAFRKTATISQTIEYLEERYDF